LKKLLENIAFLHLCSNDAVN